MLLCLGLSTWALMALALQSSALAAYGVRRTQNNDHRQVKDFGRSAPQAGQARMSTVMLQPLKYSFGLAPAV